MDEARSLTYSINVTAALAKAEEDIRNFVSTLGRLQDQTSSSIDINVGANTEGAAESVRELTSDIGDLQTEADSGVVVNADTDQAEQNIRTLTGEIGNIDADDIEIEADTVQAQTDVQSLQERVTNLGRDPPDIKIDADTSGAENSIRGLTDDIGKLEGEADGIGSAFRKSFLTGIDSGESFASSIRSGVVGAITTMGEKAGGIGSAFSSSFRTGIDSGNSLAASLKSGLGGALGYAKDKAEDFKDNVVAGAQRIGNGFAHPIETIKTGLGNALQSAKDKFIDMARGAEKASDDADDMADSADDAADNVADLGKATHEAGDAAEKSGGKFEAFGSILKGVGVAVLAATTAVTGFAVASVGVGMEFDSSMSQVAATMGYSVEELNTVGSEANETFTQLREFAMEMGSSTAFSATEAADALNYMALAGYDAETSMSMLPNVLNLAAAGGIDLASASDMVTDAQSALGLSLVETTDLVDKMAMASSKSNTSVAQLGSAILTVGGTAQNLAGGTTELSTALGILADNGIKGAEGGTHLRNVILSLSKPTDVAAKALNELGIEVYDAEGNMRPLNDTLGALNDAMSDMTQAERTDLIGTIFNRTDLASVTALLAGTTSGLNDVGAALEASGVDWEKYADKAWASVDGMSQGLIDDIKYNLGELGTSAEEFQEYLQFEYGLEADDAMAVIAAMGTRWDELSGYIDEAAGAAQDMADTQLDNLAGDITLFQSALEGAQIVISDALTPTLREFTQFGTEAISTLSEAFQEGGLSGAMGALGTILSDGLSMVIEMLPTMIDAGMQLLGALGQGILSNLPTLIGAASQIVVTLASGIGTALPDLIPSVYETIFLVAGTLLDNMPLILDAGMQIIGGLTEGILNSIPILVEQLPELILQIVGFLSDSLPTILEQGSQMILSLGMGIIEAIPQLVSQLPTIISSIVGFITENLPLIVSTGVNLVVQLGVGLIQAIPELVAQLPQIVAAIIGGFAEVPGMMLDIGKNIVEGVWNGITAMGSWIKDKVSGFFGGIVDGVKGLLGIHSPSTVFADIGDNMALGLGEGFTSGMAGVVEDIEGAIPTNLDGPDIDLQDTNVPDVTYGVYPNVEDYDLPGNGGPTSYTVNPVIEGFEAIGNAVEDVAYKVSPIIEDIKTPPVSDLTYSVSPLVDGFNPPGYEDQDEPEDNGDGKNPPPEVYWTPGEGGGNPGVTGGNAGAAQFTFAPEVTIPITVEGSVDDQTIERLREELREELTQTMRGLFEEWRQEELEQMTLKKQYAF